MKTLYLNGAGDLEFDGLNNLEMVDDLKEVKQRLLLALRTNKGEWFLNQRFGVPWFDMLSQNEPPESFRKEALKVLNDDPAVDEVEGIEVDFDRGRRDLEIKFTVLIDDERYKESVVM